ncbi:hypothetical protein J6590_108630 [Homalodisca vitripennis]|nr:hypothetical protein J6590_108630 [Homalodisca vitripennis]
MQGVENKKKLFDMNKERKRLPKNKELENKRLISRKKEESSEDDEEEDCFCLVCTGPYKESKLGDDWVQCMECKKWAHVKCTKNERFYVCINCHSEMEMGSSSDDNE